MAFLSLLSLLISQACSTLRQFSCSQSLAWAPSDHVILKIPSFCGCTADKVSWYVRSSWDFDMIMILRLETFRWSFRGFSLTKLYSIIDPTQNWTENRCKLLISKLVPLILFSAVVYWTLVGHKIIIFAFVPINHKLNFILLIHTFLIVSISESGNNRPKVIASSGGCDIIIVASSSRLHVNSKSKPENIVQHECVKNISQKKAKREWKSFAACRQIWVLLIIWRHLTAFVRKALISQRKKASSEKWKDQRTNWRSKKRRWSLWKLSKSINCEKD